MFRGKKISLVEVLVVTLLSTIAVFGVLCFLGTLTSGWHLVDDHEFLEVTYMFKYQDKSLFDVIKWALSWDSKTRNRFLYYPFRIFVCWLVGADPFVLSIIKGIEVIVLLVLLYACGKKITGSFGFSLLFSLTCMVGYQSAIWWKLGPEHVQAGICFAIALLTLLKWLETPAKKIYAVISIIFAVAMGFFHESFVLVMPFFALYPIYEKIREKSSTLKELIKAAKAECKGIWWYTITLMACCMAVLLSIVVRLGLNSYDPVSFDSHTSIYQYVMTFKESLTDGLKWYWIFGIVLIGIILTYYDKVKSRWLDVIMLLIFALPQFALYSKEGIAERYIIPIVFGVAMFYILFVCRNGFLDGGRKKAYVAVLVLMLLLNARGMTVEGDYYRFRGESVTNALEVTDDLTDKGYNVMCCLGNANPEADWTVSMYQKSHGKRDVFYLDTEKGMATDVRPMLKDENANLYDVADMDVIYAYNRDDRHFEVEPGIDFAGYVYKKCGSIDFYFKESVIAELGEDYLENLTVKPTMYGIGN